MLTRLHPLSGGRSAGWPSSAVYTHYVTDKRRPVTRQDLIESGLVYGGLTVILIGLFAFPRDSVIGNSFIGIGALAIVVYFARGGWRKRRR